VLGLGGLQPVRTGGRGADPVALAFFFEIEFDELKNVPLVFDD
jgi:hypothetical protein